MTAPRPRIVAALWCALVAPVSAAPADDATTFDSGPVLGQRLLHNLVRIAADDLQQHGFGLVVGTDARYAYIATARHVVANRPPAGLEGPETASRAIAVGFCAQAATAPRQPAEMIEAFDGAGDDLALLRTALPDGYAPVRRALALPMRDAVGEPAWQLGREHDCALVATTGTLAVLADDRRQLRIDLHGVLGGGSGGPVVSGYGVIGLIKRSDNEKITAHAIADLRARVQAVTAAHFTLEPARNIPPGVPLAAVVDLTETLNDYLFGARNLQTLLKQGVVPRSTFAQFVERYGRSVERFMAARDKYDGTLQAHWADDVLPEWQALREQLWKIHMVMFALNGDPAKTITRTERSPPAVQAQMAELEPDLVRLQAGIAQFAAHLAHQGTDHAPPPNPP